MNNNTNNNDNNGNTSGQHYLYSVDTTRCSCYYIESFYRCIIVFIHENEIKAACGIKLMSRFSVVIIIIPSSLLLLRFTPSVAGLKGVRGAGPPMAHYTCYRWL